MPESNKELTEKLNEKSHDTQPIEDDSKISIYQNEEQILMHRKLKMTATEKISSVQNDYMWRPQPSTIVHILVTIFGTSAWIGVNGIFIQLPLLVHSSPESWGLAAYLVVAIQAANIAPIIYSVLHKYLIKINESYYILVMLGIGCLVMGLLVFLYDKTSNIGDKKYSTALFVLTFFTSAVSCTSSVLFMPYLRNFKEVYLVSYFIGEGLSGVLPSIVAFIQGIGENHVCNRNSNNTETADDVYPRFPPKYYFFFIFIVLLLSLVAFFLLENLNYIAKEKISSRLLSSNKTNNEVENFHCQRQTSVLSETSISQNDVAEKQVDIDNYKKTDVEDNSNVHYTSYKKEMTLKDLYLYIILSIICLLANGLFPGLQPFSCLSYGNMTYHLSTTLSQIANPSICLLALWFLPHSLKIINWLSAVVFIISGYVMYLALVSPNPPLQNSNFGKFLVISSWILLVGLISYVKLIITSVFRRKSEQSLFTVGVIMQAGSACGAVLSFVLINYTTLLHEYKPCNDSENSLNL